MDETCLHCGCPNGLIMNACGILLCPDCFSEESSRVNLEELWEDAWPLWDGIEDVPWDLDYYMSLLEPREKVNWQEEGF